MLHVGNTLLIMPAFNESEAISDVIREVRRTVPELDILVVNDCSRDNTSEVARSASVLVADLPFNLGVGGAMRFGFRYAIRNGYSAAVQLDADGQHDPIWIQTLIDGLAQADIVIGARFAGTGSYTVRGPRRWAMKMLASTLSTITRAKLTDATSGYKAVGPKALNLFANDYPAEYLGDTVEALVIAARDGCRVAQIPVEMRERAGGVPSQGPVKSAVYLGRAFLALLLALLRPSRERSS